MPIPKDFSEVFRVNEIRFLGTGEDVSPDYLDFIIRKGFENEAIHTVMRYLAAENGWDIVHLTDMLSTSITAEVNSESGRGQRTYR